MTKQVEWVKHPFDLSWRSNAGMIVTEAELQNYLSKTTMRPKTKEEMFIILNKIVDERKPK